MVVFVYSMLHKKKNIHTVVIMVLLNPTTGMIKSDSLTSRATDFWGRASEKLPPARPRTSVFLWPVLSKADVFKRVKINNWLLNTHRQVA